MSKYFKDYDCKDVASIYDKERYPVGADVMAGMLHIHCKRSLKDIHILDAGCGTGLYTKALLNHGVGRFTLLDASTEMLNVAREKLVDASTDNVVTEIVEAVLPEPPFENISLDAVMFNSVLHHLDYGKGGGQFPALERTLQETKRVLRPNGVLLVTTVTPSILKEAIWFTQLHDGVPHKKLKAIPSNKQYVEMFAKHGFKCVSEMNILTGATPSLFKNYFDAEGPLKEDWRMNTSAFGLASGPEITEIESMVTEMKEKGALEHFVTEHDRTSELDIREHKAPVFTPSIYLVKLQGIVLKLL